MQPRFRIRSLVLLVFIVALVLGVSVLTVENRCLRRVLQTSRAEAEALNARQHELVRVFLGSVVVNAQRHHTDLVLNSLARNEVDLHDDALDPRMPQGADAFAGSAANAPHP